MGLFDLLFQAAKSVAGISMGSAKLSDAINEAPNKRGCYKMVLDGEIKYVGKAEDGLRKRFVQYYNGTAGGYHSADMIHSYRNDITVQWVELDSREACRHFEKKWIEQYEPEWNERSGWSGY